MKFQTILHAAVAAVLPSAYAASISYQFTGGSLVATTSGLPAGMTASDVYDFVLPTALNWAAVSGTGGNAMRIGHEDLLSNSTSTALSSRNFTFSFKIPVGVTLDLTSLTYDFTSNGLAGTDFINARLFSTIQGTNDATGDTIAFVGRVANGANSGTGVTVNLANPTLNSGVGVNVTANDFKNLTNQTITFSLPFIRSGTATGDYMEIDNIQLNFTPIPEPRAALLGGFGLLALLRRRR